MAVEIFADSSHVALLVNRRGATFLNVIGLAQLRYLWRREASHAMWRTARARGERLHAQRHINKRFLQNVTPLAATPTIYVKTTALALFLV